MSVTSFGQSNTYILKIYLSFGTKLQLQSTKWGLNVLIIVNLPNLLMAFLPSSGHVSITVWMHHLDSSETLGEKARWYLQTNAMCCFEQIMEVTPEKIAAVLPLASHFTKHSSKTNDMLGTAGEARTNSLTTLSYELLYMDISVDCPAKTFILHLCVDTRYHLEDLPQMLWVCQGYPYYQHTFMIIVLTFAHVFHSLL